jgi:hypothetical protein
MDFNRMAITIADLKRKRATLVAEMKAISTKDAPEEGDSSRFDDLEAQVKDHDERIGRIEAVNPESFPKDIKPPALVSPSVRPMRQKEPAQPASLLVLA